MLDIGEQPADRYALGQTFSVLVFQMTPHPDSGAAQYSIRRTADYLERLATLKEGSVVIGTVVQTYDVGIEIDVNGVRGNCVGFEVGLTADQSPHDHFNTGDQLTALVLSVDHDARYLGLSVRRATPGYDEALATFNVGDITTGSVTFIDSGGLELDVGGGVVGGVGASELPLSGGEVPADRYSIGDQIKAFVWFINHDARYLGLSVRRAAPGYDETLAAFKIGDIVTGSVTYVGSGSLHLDVGGGVVGGAGASELPLSGGEVPADRYSIGDQIKAFVWFINHDARYLGLSVRHAAPGYDEALATFNVGDIVTGSVASVDSDGLKLDVGGVVGVAMASELPLAEGEVPADRYSVGDQVKAFVWSIKHDSRDLGLSVRRATPGYNETLATFNVGDIVTGSVAFICSGSLHLDVDGVVGFIPWFELLLAKDEVPADSYTTRQQIKALVWDIDRVRGDLRLSVRRLESGFIEAPSPVGTQLDAIVQSTIPGGIHVQTAHGESFIPDYALSLSIGSRPRFEIQQRLSVIVATVNDDGKPATLSHRRALDGWEREAKRFVRGTLVQDAQVIPHAALPEGEHRASIDLGPIIGFISEKELPRESALELMSHLPNTQYPVMVESLDGDSGFAIVSREKFDDRWRELAAQFSDGSEVNAEIRMLHRGVAHVDLGSGLLATMPSDAIPVTDGEGESTHDLIGRSIPVRVVRINRDNQHIEVEHRDHWIEMRINDPESQTLEFKPKLKGSKNRNDAREMIREVIRTIAAFLNTDGGNLIIGVTDSTRELIGLEEDEGVTGDTIEKRIDIAGHILNANLESIRRKSVREEFDIRNLVTWEARIIRGKIILVITCKRGPDSGVDVRVKKTATFWAREGDSTRELTEDAEILKHLQDRDRRREEETE